DGTRERADRREVARSKTVVDCERRQYGDRILAKIQHDGERPQTVVVLKQRSFHLCGELLRVGPAAEGEHGSGNRRGGADADERQTNPSPATFGNPFRDQEPNPKRQSYSRRDNKAKDRRAQQQSLHRDLRRDSYARNLPAISADWSLDGTMRRSSHARDRRRRESLR